MGICGLFVWVVAGLYRIFRYLDEKKNTTTLVFGILFIVPFVSFFSSIVDIFTVATEDKIKFLAD